MVLTSLEAPNHTASSQLVYLAAGRDASRASTTPIRSSWFGNQPDSHEVQPEEPGLEWVSRSHQSRRDGDSMEPNPYEPPKAANHLYLRPHSYAKSIN